jgi:hypothetical protein
MKFPRRDNVALTILGIIIGSLGLITVFIVALFLLLPVGFTCRGAKALNYLHLEDNAGVRCACDPEAPKAGCYP